MSKTNGWQRVCIKDVCESIIDCVNKTAPTVDYPTPYKMIRTTNVKAGWVHLSDVKYVTEEVFKTWTRRAVPQKGDVILTREAPLGEVGMLRGDESVFLGQRLVQYRADTSKLDNRFLLYCFQADDLQGQIKALGSGATVEHMRVPDAEKLTLLLPPLPVQKRIADILSAYDDLIENNTRRIKILEEMARSLYDEWFVKFRFPGHEQTKLIDSELGLIPEGWEIKTFGDVSLNFDRKRIPLSSIQRSKRQGEYRYYGASGVIDYIDDYIFDGKYLLIAEDGENLNSRKLPIAFLASGKFWVNNHAHIVQGKSPVSSELLRLFMEALDISGYITGAAQPKLSQSNLNRIPFILPSEQLLNRFNEVACQLLNQVENLHRKNQNLQKTRDLLLPKLISGEIDVEKLEVTEEEEAIIQGGELVAV
ncbi:MAG TPA: restriction endonuclease subunit S [Leptolyngbyaceae cyanobacterium M33_DOE_097]|nr:restriction endonuclease subunit S [Leptolyngbyaceae cyanobacterium M33_DOE_097]